jgi:hypothetical protein
MPEHIACWDKLRWRHAVSSAISRKGILSVCTLVDSIDTGSRANPTMHGHAVCLPLEVIHLPKRLVDVPRRPSACMQYSDMPWGELEGCLTFNLDRGVAADHHKHFVDLNIDNHAGSDFPHPSLVPAIGRFPEHARKRAGIAGANLLRL